MRRPRQTRVHLKRLGMIQCVDCGLLYSAWYRATLPAIETAKLGQTVGLAPSAYPPRCDRCQKEFKERKQGELEL